MLQVCPAEVRLLRGVRTLVQTLHLRELLPADTDFEGLLIVAADVLDPYVLLRMDDGTAVLLTANSATGTRPPRHLACLACYELMLGKRVPNILNPKSTVSQLVYQAQAPTQPASYLSFEYTLVFTRVQALSQVIYQCKV